MRSTQVPDPRKDLFSRGERSLMKWKTKAFLTKKCVWLLFAFWFACAIAKCSILNWIELIRKWISMSSWKDYAKLVGYNTIDYKNIPVNSKLNIPLKSVTMHAMYVEEKILMKERVMEKKRDEKEVSWQRFVKNLASPTKKILLMPMRFDCKFCNNTIARVFVLHSGAISQVLPLLNN